MFGIFKNKFSKQTEVSEKAPHWVLTGNYTFNKKPESEPDTFNKVTHGRMPEMLDDDDMAWTIPRQKQSTGCLSTRYYDL